MPTQEQLEDNETAKAVIMAAFHAIDREHVKAYAVGALSQPGEMTDSERRDFVDALFSFAALGWATFHGMNKGQPLKARAKPERKKATKKKRASVK